MKRNKSIRSKILSSVLALMSVSLLVLGSISIYLLYTSSQNILEETMTETAEIAAERVSQEIISYENIAAELGCISELANENVSIAEKKAIMDQKLVTYNLVEANVINADGINIFNDVDCNGRAYYEASIKGKIHITEPTVSQVTGKLTMFISAPLWKDGLPNSEIVGVIMLIPQEDFLDSIMKSIKVSSNGGAYILDLSGTAVAHTTEGLVINGNNSIELAKTDSSLKAIAALEKKMIAGESGFGQYTFQGVKKFLAYAPISGTNGWSLGVSAPTGDFMGSTTTGIIVTIVIVLVSLLLSIIIVRRIAINISSPIEKCSNRLNLLSQGDFHTPVAMIDAEDETGVLAASTAGIVDTMNTIITDVAYLLDEMASGNFNVFSKAKSSYIGDYQPILLSLASLKRSLSDTLQSIDESAAQVAFGSEQMSEGAQVLAEGAMDQSASIEELLATVNDIADKVKSSAEEANRTSSSAKTIGEQARHSTTQVSEMTTAMTRISESSKEIGNIISSIEDIATQTNLLSLNAAIEAARAGESGRGFSVVAEEIRKLAFQSADAVEDTRVLIDTALNEVESGTSMVEATAASLNEIIVRIEMVITSIEGVAASFDVQADAINQINVGVEQISNVVQNNSATAEESSATSQELSAQAATLKQLVDQFKLAV